MNERITEDIVRDHFKNDNLTNDIKIDEQIPDNPKLKELLKNASKRQGGGIGKPEFIITFPEILDSVIIIECKAELKDHSSKKNETPNPEKYAVDGILHYANFLKDDFNVMAIAVSGKKEDEIKISHFYFKKKSKEPKILTDNKLLTVYDYLNIFEKSDLSQKLRNINLLKFSSALNKQLYNYSVPENERATIVSGILIALQNKSFRQSYKIYKQPLELVEDLLNAIERELNSKNLGSKSKILMGEYQKISQSHNLAISTTIKNSETGKDEKNTLLRDIIYEIHNKVFPFIEHGTDLLGQFYSEFIKYVYGDKKLGLVLTPYHITELFVEIANPNLNSIIYDNCCGTGGFLIKAMEKLVDMAGNDSDKKTEIRETQLIGVEARTDMFTYACSNMMMRGDGKSNIFLGDSLSQSMKEKIKKFKPTIGLLNPPYATKISELEFVYHNLECLQNNGICVAIMPISCVTADGGDNLIWKTKLLEKHTLEAVFSMPLELFNPAVNTGTVIVVFKAHTPHPKNYETYFGLWIDDGYIKVKHLGRVDFNNRWNYIKHDWINNYRNKKEVKEKYVKKYVQPEDEWCAEAYLETDYSHIQESDFEDEIKKYNMYKMANTSLTDKNERKDSKLYTRKWKMFPYQKLFTIKKGKRLVISQLNKEAKNGTCPYISAISKNNGISDRINVKPNHKKNTITVNYDGSVGEAFYQPEDFWASDSVNVLYPKFNLNENIAMFLIMLIRKEAYRFNYYRKWTSEKMNETTISLPVDKDGEPDWKFMEDYIKSLPYSTNLK